MVTAEAWSDHTRPYALDGEVDIERDRHLVERAQQGDKSAFDDLYACYVTRLERYCLQRLRDPHEAQDVAQEAFLRAWRALPNFGGDRRFYPWLSVIASNLCTDALRRRQRFGPIPVAEPQERDMGYAKSTEDSVVELADIDLAAKALSQLSPRHRRVLELRERSGLTYQEIAEQEGLRITTVETLIWRARQAFKREFLELTGTDGALIGVLGLGAAAKGGFFRRLIRIPKSVPARFVAMGPQSIAASVGGAVATAAIVVASVSGGHPAAHAAAGATEIGQPRAGAALGASETGSGGHTTGSRAPARTSLPSDTPTSAVNGSAGPTTGANTSTSSTTSGPIGSVTGGLGLNGSGKGVSRTLTTVAGAGGVISSSLGKTVQGVTGAAGQIVGGVGDAVGGLTNGVEKTAGGIVGGAAGTAAQTLKNAEQTLEKAGESVNEAVQSATGDAEQAVAQAKGALSQAIGDLGNATNGASSAAKSVTNGLGQVLSGGSSSDSSGGSGSSGSSSTDPDPGASGLLNRLLG